MQDNFYQNEIKRLTNIINNSNEVHDQIIESYEKELKEIIDKAKEYINKFKDSPEYIDAYDITYWQEEVLSILKEAQK